MAMQLKIISGKVGGAMKVVVYGPEGIGKSTFASQFPNPLFIDTEGSTKFLNVHRTEKPSSWSMLMEQVRSIRDTTGICSTLVIDTADWAEQLCTSNICAQKKLSGIEDMGYGKGYVYLAEEFGRLLNLLDEIILRGVHIVLTAHAKMRKFEQPDEMGAYDRWEMKLQQKTAALLKEWTDVLIFANYKTMSVAADDKGKKFKAQGGRRVMYTSHHPCWDAKNRLGLPEELEFSYAPLAPYFNIDVAPQDASENPTNAADILGPAHIQSPVTPPMSTEVSAPGSTPPAPAQPAPSTTPPVPQPTTAPSQTPPSTPDKPPEDYTNINAPKEQKPESSALKALRDLMKQNNVYDGEIQAAVAAKGYFPENTPLENYPDDFIQGVLIGAWKQVHGWIVDNQPLPF